MPEKELLENVHCLLSNQLEGSGAVLSMHLHPDDIVAKEFCREHSLEFDEDRASIFIEPDKTDRIGMKVEWFATKNAGDKIQRVELMDTLTIYSCNHGSDRIDPPLVESGGSFERLLALREGVDHVQLSSAFDVAGMQKVAEAAQYEIKLEQALVLQDLIRPIVIMAGSGFCLPESHKKGTKQEKAFYSACHELVLSALEMQLPASLLPRLIEHDVRYLKHWKSAGYDFAKLEVTMPAQSITSVSESLQARYDSTLRYMRQNRGKWADEELVRRAANLYFGGATRLAILALQDIG